MRKRYSALLSIAAVAAIGATLLGSTYSQQQMFGVQTQSSSAGFDADPEWAKHWGNVAEQKQQDALNAKLDAELANSIREAGGLTLVMPAAFAEVDPDKIPELKQQGRNVVEANLVAQSVELPVMGHKPGSPKTYKAMTFNGQVPAPTIRATQGDIIKMTLTVPESEPIAHSNDLHASQISAIPNFGAVQPGESLTYAFIAESPGTFKYHCEGINVADMDRHSLSGMNGMTIVDPLDGYRKLLTHKTEVQNGQVKEVRKWYPADALEFQLVFNELYFNEDGSFNREGMFKQQPTQFTINGMAFGYTPNSQHNKIVTGDANKNLFVAQPWNSADLNQYRGQVLSVPTDKHVRFFVENNGNAPVYFHIVGEQLDRVIESNRVQEVQAETYMIGGSDGAIMDVVFDDPGVYAPVNHDYANLFKGQAMVVVAGDAFGLAGAEGMPDTIKTYAALLGNPTDAVPPMGENSVAHPKLVVHGLYTDERAQEIAQETGASIPGMQ